MQFLRILMQFLLNCVKFKAFKWNFKDFKWNFKDFKWNFDHFLLNCMKCDQVLKNFHEIQSISTKLYEILRNSIKFD